jgi:hypothetical protein
VLTHALGQLEVAGDLQVEGGVDVVVDALVVDERVGCLLCGIGTAATQAGAVILGVLVEVVVDAVALGLRGEGLAARLVIGAALSSTASVAAMTMASRSRSFLRLNLAAT